MRSIVFYPDIADDLNGYVSEKIAPHLFLSCHYAPEPSPVFGADAKFIRGALNLYKFTFDSSIIGRLEELAKRYGIVYKKERLREMLDVIQVLRTIEGHNRSEGDIGVKFARWCSETIGKEQFTTLEDYGKAVTALERMGNELCNILHTYIQRASVNRNKEDLIVSWENMILSFYSRKSNARIFEEQLRMAYLSRCHDVTGNPAQNRYMRRKLAEWCRNYYLSGYENQIEIQSSILRKYSGKLSGQQREQIEIQIETSKKKIQDTNQKIAREMHCRDAEQMNGYFYMDYYFMNLGKALKEILEDIKAAQAGTMFPEDIMQRLIERDFEGISGEDF